MYILTLINLDMCDYRVIFTKKKQPNIMQEKTVITEEFLIKNGFEIYKVDGRVRMFFKDKLIFQFGSSNIPCLYRKINSRLPGKEEYVVGIKYWEEVPKFYSADEEFYSLMDQLKKIWEYLKPNEKWSLDTYYETSFLWIGKEKELKEEVLRLERSKKFGETLINKSPAPLMAGQTIYVLPSHHCKGAEREPYPAEISKVSKKYFELEKHNGRKFFINSMTEKTETNYVSQCYLAMEDILIKKEIQKLESYIKTFFSKLTATGLSLDQLREIGAMITKLE